jgi:hypothetical protein
MEKRAALLIGATEYSDHRLAALSAPQSDIDGLAEVLSSAAIGAFQTVDVLMNESNEELRRRIARFCADRRRADLLFLYFSCHGLLDRNGSLYFAARDTDRDYPSATALAATFVRQLLDECASKRQILVLDCCHSGAFPQGSKGSGDFAARTGEVLTANGFGRIVLTATDSTQLAFEGKSVGLPSRRSVFTHFIVEGLKSGAADLDHDGLISVDELYQYSYEAMEHLTVGQTPGKWAYRLQGRLIVAQVPSAAPGGRPPNEIALHAVDERRYLRFYGPRLRFGRRALLLGAVGTTGVLGASVWIRRHRAFRAAYAALAGTLDAYVLRARDYMMLYRDAATDALDRVARRQTAPVQTPEKEKRLTPAQIAYDSVLTTLRINRERDYENVRSYAPLGSPVPRLVAGAQELVLEQIHLNNLERLGELSRDIDAAERLVRAREDPGRSAPLLLDRMNNLMHGAEKGLEKLDHILVELRHQVAGVD